MDKNRKTLKKITIWAAVFICGLFLFSSLSAKADTTDNHINALKPTHKKLNHISKGKTKNKNVEYPSSYRADNQMWAEGIQVRDQMESGTCWAFATITSAEYSYAKEYFETYGAVKEGSPGHLAYNMFNRDNDPLGKTEGDRIVIKRGQPAWPLIGGDAIYAMQHLATYSGVGLEQNTPFDNINDCIQNDSFDRVKWKQYEPEWRAHDYDDYITLEESDFRNLSGEEGSNTLKEMVMEYGGVECGIEMDTDYYNDENSTFYNYYNRMYSDHAITVVGWDDDFPKEKFEQDDRGSIYEPEHDGAWIVQNSWGTEWGDNGFFYVSYDSGGFTTDNEAFGFDMQPANEYYYNFQYDGTSDCGDSSDSGNEKFFTCKGSQAANVYENTTGETVLLDAVGITTYNDGPSKYIIKIYTDITDSTNPTSGSLVETTTAFTNSAGCKTLNLDEAVPIEDGENYSIVISFVGEDNAFGIEKSDESMGNAVKYVASTAPGQSFFKKYTYGTWVDMNNNEACFRIKGLAKQITNPSDWKIIDPNIQLSNTYFVYNGKEQKPEVVVKDGERVLDDSFYDVTYPEESVEIGKYNVMVTLKNGYSGSGAAEYEISDIPPTTAVVPTTHIEPTPGGDVVKVANTVKVRVKKPKIKRSKIQKKRQAIALKKWALIIDAKGTICFRLKTAKKGKKSFMKKIKINAKTGRITLKKGMKKGTYKLRIAINVSGDNNYNPIKKIVTVKVKIK